MATDFVDVEPAVLELVRTRCLALPEVWDEPAWTGRIVADRARSWGWTPRVDLPAALQELADGLRA